MTLATIFLISASSQGIPHDLLSSLCFVESSHRPNVVVMDSNGHNSVGLCQMQLRTARWMGFRGEETDLLNPKINAQWAARYLRYQYDRYGNWTMAVKAYNAGFARTSEPNLYSKKVLANVKTVQ